MGGIYAMWVTVHGDRRLGKRSLETSLAVLLLLRDLDTIGCETGIHSHQAIPGLEIRSQYADDHRAALRVCATWTRSSGLRLVIVDETKPAANLRAKILGR